ncbi:family 92 glycosyl hydrolase [Chytriomyces sp. MP71]|nr:family 92 glycosyl hydrolase [Chytriomyces sp. MP71]
MFDHHNLNANTISDGWASYFGQKQNYAEYPVFSCTAGAQLASRYGVLSNYENLHSTASDSTLAIKTSRTVGIYDYSGSGDNVGGYLSFDIDLDGTDQVDVILNVGLSFKSMDQACNHLKEAQEKSFEEVEGENARLWSLAMDAIEVRNPIMRGSETTILYSSLYRIFFMPANRTGEHPTWPDGTESLTYFDDYYTIWDTFRTTNPLLTLIDPELQSALIQSLINTAKYARGYFGDSQVGNHFGVTQGGNNGEILIAEAFLKKLPGINYTEAYEYVNRSVYTQTPLHYVFEGRGDVKDYLTNGYVGKKDAAEFAEDKDTMFSGNGDGFKSISVSRTLEYAYADFSISFLAKGLGYNRDAAAARKRSGNWKNLWDNETLDHGFQGFLQPRARAREAGKLGEWKRMSVTFGSPMENFHQYKEFYEDSSWSYSFFAPQNVASLIEYMGGVGTFLRRLDAFFELGHYNPGNEPSFLVPTLYHYAGRPDLSVRRVDFIVNHNYTAQPDGIPGNDDAGAMASWYICASIGLFPVAGQDIYLLLAPRFESITMKVGSKKEDGSRNQFLIRIQNVDDGDVNGEARIIQRATLNGNDLSRAWLRHEEIVRGGELVLLMGAKDSLWGTKEVDLPPSYNETE